MYKLITMVWSVLRITPNSAFLAAYLIKSYLLYLTRKHVEFDGVFEFEIVFAGLLIACKMRERDINCPMISHLVEITSSIFYNP